MWLAGRPNQEHLLARCGFDSSCLSRAGQQEAAVLRINVSASPRLNPSALRQKFDELVIRCVTSRPDTRFPRTCRLRSGL